LHDGRVAVRGEAVAPPGTRAKVLRIASARHHQLVAFLTKENTEPEGELFATLDATPAAIFASFAWSSLSALSGMAFAFIACTLAALPLMGRALGEIGARSEILRQAGAIPLPSPEALDAMGFGFLLGSAVLFAFPVAFLVGLLHALALTAGELWTRAARLGQASFLASAALLAYALVPALPVYISLPAALGVPLAAHFGYVLIWGRRKERPRKEARPFRLPVVLAVLAVAVVALVLIVPAPAPGRELPDRLALFRDRYLLGHPIGKAAATFYYEHTLCSAHPLKRFFSTDPDVIVHVQRTALVTDGESTRLFRALGFTVSLAGDPVAHDVAWDGQTLSSRGQEVRPPLPLKAGTLSETLERLSAMSFRGGPLLNLNALAWRTLYYAGPPFAAVLFVALCCPWISMLYLAMRPKTATFALLACLASTMVLLVVDYARQRDEHELVNLLRGKPADEEIVSALRHPSPYVRYEATLRAHQDPSPALVEALLEAGDDPDVRVRLLACGALGRTRDERAMPLLLKRLHDPEFFVRYRAAKGLGDMGNPEAAEPLRRMMREGSWYEGVYALEALRRVDPESR
jgi:hypothetical protein